MMLQTIIIIFQTLCFVVTAHLRDVRPKQPGSFSGFAVKRYLILSISTFVPLTLACSIETMSILPGVWCPVQHKPGQV